MTPHAARLLAAIALSALGHVALLTIIDQPRQIVQKAAPVVLHAKINWHPAAQQQESTEQGTAQKEGQNTPHDKSDEKHSAPTRSENTPAGLSPYHEARELDSRPEIVEDIPINPPELLDQPAGGTLVLKLWINAGGGVDAATLERSSLPVPFSTQAINAFKNARFKPGEKGGIAVGSTMLVELSYLPLKQPGRPEYLPSPLPPQ